MESTCLLFTKASLKEEEPNSRGTHQTSRDLKQHQCRLPDKRQIKHFKKMICYQTQVTIILKTYYPQILYR